jgi:hypothetical protein
MATCKRHELQRHKYMASKVKYADTIRTAIITAEVQSGSS